MSVIFVRTLSAAARGKNPLTQPTPLSRAVPPATPRNLRRDQLGSIACELGFWVTLHHSPTEPSSWKTRAMGFEPPKGYLLKEASLSSKPNPGFVGRGNLPFTMRIVGKPNH